MRFYAGFIRASLISSSVLASGIPPLQRRDADFESVRTHLITSYHDIDTDAPDKYFHESTFDGHYDGRFAAERLDPLDKRAALTALIQSYLIFMSSHGAETWLMHGTLLGWWWNRQVLPWDSDVDVMTSEKSLRFLAAYHNMTVHTFAFPSSPSSPSPPKAGSERIRSYLLEINPHSTDGTRDSDNGIDARWIDRECGVFVDITTARWNHTTTARSSPEAETMDRETIVVKDGHVYLYDNIWPLRETVFEGVPAWIPFAYADLLVDEYGPEALAGSRFMGYRFDVGEQRWVSDGGRKGMGLTKHKGRTWLQWIFGWG